MSDRPPLAIPMQFADRVRARPPLTVAVVFHCFHAELFDEALWLASNAGASHLYVTTDTAEKAAHLRRSAGGWPGRTVMRLVENRGRDLPSKLIVFRDEIRSHDLVLFLRSKRDSHEEDGALWREHLFHNLAGSEAIVGSIMAMFESDPRLGVVFPDHWPPVRPWVRWGPNWSIAVPIVAKMGLRLSRWREVEFPSGSMFWARPAALEPLVQLGFQLSDFPEEPIAQDGTLAHALERCFLISCVEAGFRWIKVLDPAREVDVEQGRSGSLVIGSRAALAAKLSRHASGRAEVGWRVPRRWG